MRPQTPADIRVLALGAAIFLAAGFFVGTESAGLVPWTSRAPATEGPDGADLKPLYKAWELLDENFAPATTTASSTLAVDDKVWGMISGLAASYGDPYTEFLPPRQKEFFESEVQGNFGGVGMEIGIRGNVMTVIAPLKNTPASRAGIKAGDAILTVDGETTANMSVEEAVSKIRGEIGTTVTLSFSRDGEASFERVITRDRIELPTVDTLLRNDGVFVIHVYSFNAGAPEKFRNAVREFAGTGSDKMVIDLRGNPGGYLEVAVDMASWFLPVGRTVVTQDYAGDRGDEVFRSRGYDVFSDRLKLAILIDEGSASASEILAGALRDHGKATLIGQKSFGKGSVQQLFEVTGDTSLKITVARWLTPKGISISHEGIHPDIEVEISAEDLEAGRDPQLERASAYLVNRQ
jgi:carboxyl-terminal processing protease